MYVSSTIRFLFVYALLCMFQALSDSFLYMLCYVCFKHYSIILVYTLVWSVTTESTVVSFVDKGLWYMICMRHRSNKLIKRKKTITQYSSNNLLFIVFTWYNTSLYIIHPCIGIIKLSGSTKSEINASIVHKHNLMVSILILHTNLTGKEKLHPFNNCDYHTLNTFWWENVKI